MTRVSTYGQLNSTLATITRLQSDLATAQTQESSGLKSTTYQGVGSASQRLVNLDGQIARSMQYVQDGEIVSSRVSTMYSAVGNMIDVLGQYQSLLSTAMSGNSASTVALNDQAQTLMNNFVDQANTQLSGRYLFSGDKTDTAPVDLTNYPAQTYPSSADTSYYQGDDSLATFKASDDQTITYGVTADDSGFEEAIRAFSLGVNASEDPVDQDALNEAYGLVNSALDSLLVSQTKLSSASTSINSEMDVQTGLQVQLEAMTSNINEVDVAEATSRAEALQTQLEASYSAVARISKLNLFDYL